MARLFHPIVGFAGTVLASGVIIVGSLSYMHGELATAVSSLPPVKSSVRQGYVSQLPEVTAADLNIARSVPVALDMTGRAPDGDALPEAETGATATAAVFSPKTAEPETQAAGAPNGFTHRVAVNGLNVRSQPSKYGQRLFAITGGSQVAVVRSEKGWARVQLEDGRSGWVWGKMLASLD